MKTSTSEAIYLHAWNIVTNTTHRILNILYKNYGSFEWAWNSIDEAKLAVISEKIDLVKNKADVDPQRLWEKFRRNYPDIELITREDGERAAHEGGAAARYPALLKQLSKAPFGLYIWGNYTPTALQDRASISIVGTRKPSPYGAIQTQRIVQYLAQYPTLVVSGLADGVDTLAHETTLLENIPTWAVIGHGHAFFRETQRPLVKEILKNGCIISEYPPETPPDKFRFPERNRIIAGLTPLTLVTEAPRSSGANITAKIAREENREVYALTADIDRHHCQGNLDLIEQHIATPLTSYQALTEAMGLVSIQRRPQKIMEGMVSSGAKVSSAQMADPLKNRIMKSLTYKSPTEVSEILVNTGVTDISLLLEKITMLEIDGVIENIGGGYRLRHT